MYVHHPPHYEIEGLENQPPTVQLHQTPNLLLLEAPHIYSSSLKKHHFPSAKIDWSKSIIIWVLFLILSDHYFANNP